MNKTPSVLERLSQIHNEVELESRAFLDERWDRLAAGKLTEAENDELLGLADASGEAHEKYQAFKPLGSAFEKNLAAMIRARQEAEREERAADLPALAESGPEPAVKKRGALTWALGLGPLMATVVAAVFLVPSPMPPYTLQAEVSAHSTMRSGAGPASATPFGQQNALQVIDGARLQLAYRPASRPDFPLEAKLYLEKKDGSLEVAGVEPLAAATDTQDLIIFEPLVGRDLVLPGGESRLVVVIGQKGRLPEEAAIREAIAAGGTEPSFWKNWQVLLQPVTKVGP